MSDKNKQIHELMGRGCYHEWDYTDEPYLKCPHCPLLGVAGVDDDTLPDYCDSIEDAREALQFAVEQKGETAVGEALFNFLPGKIFGATSIYYTAAALAPPSVLVDAFLSIFSNALIETEDR